MDEMNSARAYTKPLDWRFVSTREMHEETFRLPRLRSKHQPTVWEITEISSNRISASALSR